MSSVNNLGNSGYYQLSNPSGGQSSGTSAGATQNTVTQSLINALSGESTTGASSGNEAYFLNLSPEAQKYLDSTTSSSTSLDKQSYILNDKQKKTITDILTKYKDEPYNQDTFNKIQNDLNSKGLGTTTLSLIDKAKSFSATSVLINALSGRPNDSTNSGVQSESEIKAKSSSYIESIVSQWKNIIGENQVETDTDKDAVQAAGATS